MKINKITVILFIINNKIMNMYNYLYNKITDIKEISTIDDELNIKYITIKFIMYNIVNKIINYLIKIRDFVDVNEKKIQLVKFNRLNNNINTYILENDNGLNFENINYFLQNNTNKTNTLSKRLYNKFEIVDSQQRHCLKKFLIKYKNNDKDLNHTLENICQFNNVIFNDESNVEISFRQNKQTRSLSFPYNQVKNKHINEFDDIE